MKHMRGTNMLVLVLLGVSTSAVAQQPIRQQRPDAAIHRQIATRAEAISTSLIGVRRDLHRHPELSGREQLTAERIKNYLTNLGLEVESGLGGDGVVGILRGGKAGPIIAWRADIDANADSSADGVEFRSENPGMKHSCGHDVHTAIGLGIADVLSSVRAQLAGTVLFVFQPAEENLTGARAMLDAGILKGRKPDAMFALHIVPLPSGVVAVKPMEMYAYRMRITIELKDVASQDEVAKICAGLLKEANIPHGTNVLGLPLLEGENSVFNPHGIFANYVAFAGAPRFKRLNDSVSVVENLAFATSDSITRAAVAGLKEKLSSSQLKDKLLTVSYAPLHPTVTNDPELTSASLRILQETAGTERIAPLYGVIPRFNDDFFFFQRETKTVYFLLGGSDFQKGIVSMPHTPTFAVDESCIGRGVSTFASLLFEIARR
jgi:metal-dependent amidase/aminoacylase/carboxypeptidase family protein